MKPVKETEPDETEHPRKKKRKEKKRKRIQAEGSESDVTAQQQSSQSSKPKKALRAATHIPKKVPPLSPRPQTAFPCPVFEHASTRGRGLGRSGHL